MIRLNPSPLQEQQTVITSETSLACFMVSDEKCLLNSCVSHSKHPGVLKLFFFFFHFQKFDHTAILCYGFIWCYFVRVGLAWICMHRPSDPPNLWSYQSFLFWVYFQRHTLSLLLGLIKHNYFCYNPTSRFGTIQPIFFSCSLEVS